MTMPPGGPPQPPPPWGNYPAPPPQPQPPNDGWKIFAGAVVGVFATIAVPFLALGVAQSVGFSAFLLSFIVVPTTSIGLIIAPVTRKWGIGLLIGWTLSLIIGAGACVALFAGMA
ncbi:hypothetical protein [Aeromicrobium fastidiosum]|uniref:Uncharacterized protein n=1 Tax=Aeromicrobium fastidiosum TaxID=52699 RepID=A0A641AMX8_9ACTN|nr:hypothetical protein [Aeromicrobium fastidiosum]KAA1378624.1 hypothetical protein ESP62_009800 [Aeromicrobium fastidiosum]MBP2392396.1 hypothetical protein [Aeromicrobium fastidiosum]